MRLVASMLSVLLLGGCEQRSLLSVLDDRNALRALVLLEQEGVLARRTVDGAGMWRVEVGKADEYRAAALLLKHRIVASHGGGEGSGSSLLSSPEMERASQEQRRATALERTLQSIPGVLEARVHLKQRLSAGSSSSIARTENALEDLQGSASVLLIASPESVLDPQAVVSIVSGGSDIPPAKVHVVINRIPQEALPVALQLQSLATSPSQLGSWIAKLQYPPLLIIGALSAIAGVGLFLARRLLGRFVLPRGERDKDDVRHSQSRERAVRAQEVLHESVP